jgi:hypothetical protein
LLTSCTYYEEYIFIFQFCFADNAGAPVVELSQSEALPAAKEAEMMAPAVPSLPETSEKADAEEILHV